MVLTRRQSVQASAAQSVNSDPIVQQSTSSEGETPQLSEVSTQPMAEPKPKKKGDFLARFFSGMALTFVFFAVVRSGHMCVAIAVVLMEIGMFHEILSLGFPVARDRRIPLWRTIGWYFFVTLQFLFYGKTILAHFEDQGRDFARHPAFQYALRHHSFLVFWMYCAGFVGFVMSLKQDQYHFQFTYFGRALVALLLVVVQSHFMILNVSHGLIWFILPCWLIIVNDSFGYFCGRLFGKHSLTRLSPKKTWEGYIGAGIFTMITAYFLSGALSSYPSLVCPKYEYSDCYLMCPPTTCDQVPSIYMPTEGQITLIPGITPAFSFTYRPVQIHAVALGLFAASIAPFGGFFASGAKRAFGVKDFGKILPGHGGVTDRVDCQVMMAVFTYVYLINFIQVSFVGSPDVGKLMSFVNELSTSEQIELVQEIFSRLDRRGLGEAVLKQLNLTIAG